MNVVRETTLVYEQPAKNTTLDELAGRSEPVLRIFAFPANGLTGLGVGVADEATRATSRDSYQALSAHEVPERCLAAMLPAEAGLVDVVRLEGAEVRDG